MRFACDNCGAQYMIADEKIGERGVKVKCKKCGEMIVVRPPSKDEASEGGANESASGQMGGAFDSMFAGVGGESVPTATESRSNFDAQRTSVYQAPLGGVDAGAAGGFDAQQTSLYQAPMGGVGLEAAGVVADDTSAHDTGAGPGLNGDPEPGGAEVTEGAAFGFQAESQSAGGETDLALGSLERGSDPKAEPTEASSRPPGEKEWYVAVDDSQVGPIDLSEIETRWDGRELDQESLAWKSGMADWVRIADIPELAYLVSERPQETPNAHTGSSFGSATAPMGGVAAGGNVGQASFEASGPAIDWQPSAASALSSLLEDEVEVEAKAEENQPGPALDGMPSFNGGDVFGNAGAAADAGFSAAAPLGDVGGGGWSVPESRSSGGSNALVYMLAGGMGLILLFAAGGGALYYVTNMQKTQGVSDPTLVPTRVEPKDGSTATPPASTVAVEPAANSAEDPQDKPSQDKPPRDKPPRDKPPRDKPPRDKPLRDKPPRDKPPRDKPPRNKPSGGDTSRPSTRSELEKSDIVDGVKKNGPKLKACLTAARSKGEILPGRYRFILNWKIQPSGGVSGGKLTGPREMMGTSLPSCFSRVMSSWRFAKSKSGAPIKNFPLPINVR